MFGKKTRKTESVNAESKTTTAKPKIETWIGGNVSIEGDIRFTGAFSVDGSIKGNVYSEDPDSTLIIGEKGYVIGDTCAANIYANGRIDGNVTASNKVELHPKARINGDLHYNLLEMAVGAGVNGKLLYQEPDEVVALEDDGTVVEADPDKT